MTDRDVQVEDVSLDWYGANDVAMQVEGFDIVSMSSIDLVTRTAHIAVYSNEIGDSETPTLAWEGDIKLPTDAPQEGQDPK